VGGAVEGGGVVRGGLVRGVVVRGAVAGGAVVVDDLVVGGKEATAGDAPSANNAAADRAVGSSSGVKAFVPVLRRVVVAVGFEPPDESFGPSLEDAGVDAPAASVDVCPICVGVSWVRACSLV
jgi:hypothetical protein